MIFALLGGIVSGFAGRKNSLTMAAPLVACGWLLVYSSLNKAMLFFGWVLSNSGTVFQTVSALPYIAETVHPKIRGSLVILPGIFLALGQFFVWFLSYFLSWRMTAFVLIIPPLLLTLMLLLLPETPYWLVSKNRFSSAKKSLEFFRGSHYDVTEELIDIKKHHQSR